MTDTLTTPRVSDPALDEGEPIFTHIVVVREGESAGGGRDCSPRQPSPVRRCRSRPPT